MVNDMGRLTERELHDGLAVFPQCENCWGDCVTCEHQDNANKKLKEYEDLEEQGLLLREEDVLKFYYCESENKYLVGKRVDTMYYAEVGKTGLCFIMSRYLPWGEHVVAPHTVWKEHTYPSEPKEIPFFDWLQGYIKQLNSKAEAEKALAEMEK